MKSRNYLIVISLFWILIFLSFFASSVFAKDIAISYERTNPGSIFYSFKRLKEKAYLKFIYKTPEKQKEYYYLLLDKRLKETAYLAKNQKLNHIEKSASRYMTTAGHLIDNFELDSNLYDQAHQYPQTFDYLSRDYQQDTSQWLFLMQCKDITQQMLSKIQ